jgi:hypothetical protein
MMERKPDPVMVTMAPIGQRPVSIVEEEPLQLGLRQLAGALPGLLAPFIEHFSCVEVLFRELETTRGHFISVVVSADVEPEEDQPHTLWVLGQPFQRSRADAELMLARDGDTGQQDEEAGDEHELAEPIRNLAEHQAEDQNGQLTKADYNCSSHRVQARPFQDH